MRTSIDGVASLSEQELLDHFAGLVVRDRRSTAELLVAIAEIDERKLWAGQACSSMFTFCVERFHMSEQVAAKRIWAARTARRFPVVLEMVARGELHLSAIHLLARHLTEENHTRVLERARHRTSREVERLVAELAPRPDVSSRIRALPLRRTAWAGGARSNGSVATNRTAGDETTTADPDGRQVSASPSHRPSDEPVVRKPIVALSPRRYKIEITVDEATHDRLRSLQDLLARSGTGRDPAAIISRAIDLLLTRTLTRKAGCLDQPGTPETANIAKSPTSRDGRPSRHIPAAVRREVWRRDSGRCCHSDRRGRRCRETSNIEFHHKVAFARGGRPTAENIELRCAAHNQHQADLDFGRSFMDARRKHSPGNVGGRRTLRAAPQLAAACFLARSV